MSTLLPSQMNALLKCTPHQGLGCIPMAGLWIYEVCKEKIENRYNNTTTLSTICNIIFHSGPRIYFKLSGIFQIAESDLYKWEDEHEHTDRTAKFRVVLPRVFAIAVPFGVVNMLRLQ